MLSAHFAEVLDGLGALAGRLLRCFNGLAEPVDDQEDEELGLPFVLMRFGVVVAVMNVPVSGPLPLLSRLLYPAA